MNENVPYIALIVDGNGCEFNVVGSVGNKQFDDQCVDDIKSCGIVINNNVLDISLKRSDVNDEDGKDMGNIDEVFVNIWVVSSNDWGNIAIDNCNIVGGGGSWDNKNDAYKSQYWGNNAIFSDNFLSINELGGYNVNSYAWIDKDDEIAYW